MSINLTVVIDNEEAVRKFRELQKTARTVTSNVITDADRMDIAMRRIATTLGQIGVAASLTGLIRQIALTRGEFQQLEVAFTTLLGNKAKADALMAQMVELAAKTPFDLQGVANGARQLLAYGFAAEDITGTLTRLGNVAAGLGLPLERLTYLYGTTAVQGRLYARDMLQFQSSGIDITGELAQMMGKTTAEITAMVSEGKIGFAEVKAAIANMTNEGGKFYNLMQEQSKTIIGLISNLGDAIDTMFNDIGKSQEGVIAGALRGTISLVENYQKVLDILIPLVAAYGAYKAALIVTAALQKAAVTTSSIKAFFDLAKGITTAKDAQLLLNMAVKANPYVLAASTLAALVAVVYRYSENSNSAARASKELGSAIEKEKNNLDKVYDAINKAQKGTNDRKIAIDNFNQLYGKYLNNLLSEKSVVEDIANAYNKAKTAVVDYAIERARESYLSNPLENVDKAKTNLRESAAKWSDRLDNAGKAGGFMSDIDKIISKIESGETFDEGALYKVITDAFAKQSEGFKDNSFYAVKTKEFALELQREFSNLQNATKEFESFSTSYKNASVVKVADSGSATITSAAQNLKAAQEAYDDAIKAWKKAIKEGADISAVKKQKESVDSAKKALDEAKKLAGVDDKTVKVTTDAQKKLNEQVIANDQALLESRIGIMKEGKAKELAEIDARTKAKLDAIDKERKEEEDRAKQAGIKLSPERETIFTEREGNARKQADNERIAVELKYAEDIDKIYKQITDDTLSEDERRIRGIKDKYQEFRKWVKTALKGGTINLKQAILFEWEIDSAEMAASLKAIVDEYGSAEDKIAKIREKAANARKTATESDRHDLIPKINKREREEIGEVKAEELMKTDDWINLFQNLDALSSKEIRRIIDNINEHLKNANLDPINLKAVTDQLDKAAETATRKNPFAAIKANFEAYKRALADGDDMRAVKLRQEAWQGVVTAIGEAGNMLNSVSGLLGQFGIESQELDGFIGALDSLASIDITKPFSVVTGIIGGFSSIIGGIFGGHDKRAENRIEKLQGQVDALQKSYENLSDAIDKAYSSDASNLIDQQNEVLKQQKVLIQNQIKEEQSKKDPDKGRIKDWQNQIDEINKIIEDNKEKAIDAIFGEDLQTAIENFADAYSEAWTSGEDRAKATKDVVKNMMRQMVVESIKAAIQSSDAMAKIREKLQEFYSDEFLSQWEQDYVLNMADKLQQELDSQFGWADSLLKDKTTSSQTATSRGFQTMSQDEGKELNGRFTDMQGKMNILVSGMDMLRSINTDTKNATIDMRDIMIQLNGNVADIRAFTKVLPTMNATLNSMNRKLDNL